VRNLIIFLRSYFNFLLFIFIEIGCLTIFLRNNSFQRSAFLNSSNFITARFYQKYNDIQYYFQLKSTNDSLVSENARLRNLLPSDYERPDTARLAVQDTDTGRKFLYLYAKVVNSNVNTSSNYITIHRGRKQHVFPNMGVISSSGVAGIVRSVSDNYAVVMSVLNRQTSISARVDSGYTGTVIWNPLLDAAHGILKDIPKSARIKNGDQVFTSGFSTLFPVGISIGYVDKITEDPSSNFHTVRIRFATNFYDLQYVYVIDDLAGDEQNKLESTEAP
jgi:rod shape-determining protein MreC